MDAPIAGCGRDQRFSFIRKDDRRRSKGLARPKAALNREVLGGQGHEVPGGRGGKERSIGSKRRAGPPGDIATGGFPPVDSLGSKIERPYPAGSAAAIPSRSVGDT